MSNAGIFVVVEGIDGAGTTTQIERYAAYLRERGRKVHVTREPSTGPIGTFVRDLLTSRRQLPSGPAFDLMALLFAADRLDHVRGEIEPALREGAVVLSDRYDLSSLAYQSVASDLSLPAHEIVGWIRTLNRFARRPDVTVVVDVAPETASKRRRHRGAPEDLYEVDALQNRLAKAYAHAEALVPGDRILHVHGDGDIETVASLLREALAPFIERSPNHAR
ncbi:MAG: dTMP kinase [Polyangiaceae bacterium]|nr:dTMP kinase [Polyangiaceae bacterium]